MVGEVVEKPLAFLGNFPGDVDAVVFVAEADGAGEADLVYVVGEGAVVGAGGRRRSCRRHW